MKCVRSSAIENSPYSRADQMATHQMYGQTGNSSEPQIDQNMHNRNYYSTRYLYHFLLRMCMRMRYMYI